MIKAEIINGDRLIYKFDTYVGRCRVEMKTAMQTIVNYLVAYIKENELSGQVLHRRTGTLSRSIKGSVDDQPARIIGNVTSRDKGNAPLSYAAFWEYGFTGSETVRSHVRKTASGGYANVRSYIRTVNQAARPFFKPAQESAINREFIKDTLNAAVRRVNQA